MFANLLKSPTDVAALILRLGLAAIFIVHGVFKIVQNFPLVPELSLSAHIAIGWVELICGFALAFGLFSRIAAVAVIALQVGAILMITGKHALEGPTVRMTGVDYTRVGPEYNMALIAMCLAVIVVGSGVLSLDHLIAYLWHHKKVATVAQPIPRVG
jgi:uncharacterized membrane protein YphA (DoxX/SURF4 family)